MSARPLAKAVRQYIPTLDGWRAIAILLVMFHHDSVHRLGPFSTTWGYDYGMVGVDVFFAISGILICTLLLEEEKQTGKIDLRGFYIRRAFRILPPAFLYLFGLVLLWLCHLAPHLTGRELIECVFFFRNYGFFRGESYYTDHFWSLSVEEHFYFFLPAFLVFCQRFRARVLVLGGIALHLVGMAAKGLLHGMLAFSDFRLSSLLIAAGVAVLLQQHNIRKIAGRVLHPAVLVVLTFLAATYFFHGRPLVLACLMTTMVASTLLRPSGLTGRLLESAPMRFIGKRSYSLYLWQQLFLTAHWGADVRVLPAQLWWLPWPCAFACACLSYSFVEQPLIRLGRRLAERTPKPAAECSILPQSAAQDRELS